MSFFEIEKLNYLKTYIDACVSMNTGKKCTSGYFKTKLKWLFMDRLEYIVYSSCLDFDYIIANRNMLKFYSNILHNMLDQK